MNIGYIKDATASAQDAANNAAVDKLVKRQQLLEANKTNAVIVDDVIYQKGEFIRLYNIKQ